MTHQFDNVGSEGTAAPSRGPWQVTTNRAADAMQFPYCVRDDKDWSVAYVTGTAGLPVTEANARLIAAAPDLLAALEAAEGVVDWALDNGAHPGARATHSMILAAIARAKGE